MASAEEKAALAKVLDARTNYVAAQEKFIKFVEDGKQEEGKAYLLDRGDAASGQLYRKIGRARSNFKAVR